MSQTITLSKQKLDLDEIRRALNDLKNNTDHKIKVLERGMQEIDKGEDMMESRSILAQEVREIMRNPFPC